MKRDINNYTVWFSPESFRYFLMENTLNITAGDLNIININGEEKQVNEQDILDYQITEAESREYIESQLKEVIENAKIPILEIAKSALQQKNQFSTDEEVIIDLVAKLTNSSPEQIKQNPELAKVGLQKFIEQFKMVIDNSLNNNLSQSGELKEKILVLQDIFKTHGLDMGDLLEKFPENLNQLASSPDFYAQETTDRLKEFSQDIHTNQNDFGRMLLNFVENYNRLFISKETEEEIRARRQKEYEEIADKAIKDSLARHPISSFTFEDLL